MIKSVVLENWKSHEKTELEFTKGTNVLIGQMGAGKTSVMDAITFALFGTFPALQSRKIKLDQCIMDKPVKKDRARVKLVFSLNDSEYEIVREVSRGKGTTVSEFRKDGALIEQGSSQRVTDAIVKEIQVDYELFSRAVYSEQNQIDYFLQIPAGQRKKKIDELLKLDRLEKARSTLTTVISRLKSQAKDKQRALQEFEEEDLEKKIKSLEEDLESIKKKGTSLLLNLEEKRKTLKEVSDNLEKLEEKQRKVRDIENKLNSLKGQLEELDGKIKVLREKLGENLARDFEHEKEKLEKEMKTLSIKLEELGLDKLQREISELNMKQGSLKTTTEELSKKLRERDELVKKLEDLKKKDWEKELVKRKEELKQLEAKLTEAKLVIENENKRLSELEKAGDRCPVCDSPISKSKKEELRKKSLKSIENAKEKIKEIEERITKVDLSEIESKVREVTVISEKLKDLDVEGKLEKVSTELKEVEKELEKKKAELDKKSSERTELEKEKEKILRELSDVERIIELQKEYRSAQKQKTEKAEQLTVLNKQIVEMKFDESALVQKRKEKEQLSVEISSLETTINSMKQLLEEKEKRLKELKLKKEQAEEWKKDVEFLKKQATSMEIFKNALEATQVQLREETLAALNAGTEDIWPRIYPYGDYTSLRLGIEGGDYILQLRRRDGTWVNVEGIASGGERSTACLALRIAFSLVLTQNLSWLVLDEPTHNLDRQGVIMLSKALREHLPELVEQVFIITHDEEMEAAVSGALYRLERDKEQDEPTRAVLVSMGLK